MTNAVEVETEEQYPMTYDEFMEHVVATDAITDRVGDLTTAVGWYCGRNVAIGTYNHATGMAELYCV